MNPDRVQRVQELFELALARPPDERAAVLAEASGDDYELRSEVASLLEHDSLAGEGFLRPPDAQNRSVVATEQAKPDPHVSEPVESLGVPQLAGYEVARELSRGGQGVVYQAIQKTTKRRVAIKVLREGPWASKTAQRRFERELSLVAQLNHANIVPILDSGTTSEGSRFYVMDYVEGMPLLEHARHRNLTVESTLEIFVEVCDGVQHAHQKGVIHRDLKQTNILVDGDGTPRILDFGLARPITGSPETLLTLTHEVLGTPAYMAPEQFSGSPDDIDTRTDIYALGVVLYELLTGHHPYPLAGSMSDYIQRTRDNEPTPLARAWTPDTGVTRTSMRRIRLGECPIDDELATIVLKAISRERDRRYQSVSELAVDLHRYLAQEPILAKRASRWYVIRKTVRRHRIAIGGTFAFFVLLISSCVALLFMYRQQLHLRTEATAHADVAQEERRRAIEAERATKQQAHRADQAYRSLKRMFMSIDPAVARGRQYSVGSLLDAAAEQIGLEFVGQPDVAAALLETIGETYERLGYFDMALQQLGRAVEIRRELQETDRFALVDALILLGRLHREMGNYKDAEASLREALEICEKSEHANAGKAIGPLQELARLLLDAQRPAEAEQFGRRALELAKEAFGERHVVVSSALTDYATIRQCRGDLDGAEKMLREALQMRRELVGPVSELAVSSLNNLGCLLYEEGEFDEAAKTFTEAADAAQRALNPGNWLIASTQSGLAACLAATKRFEEAERLLLDSYQRLEVALGAADSRTKQTVRRLVVLYSSWGKTEEAKTWREKLAERDAAKRSRNP